MANFNGLTFTVIPVVTGAGVLNTAGITAGTTMIASIVDPSSTQRIFNPQAEGLPVASGDNATKWLPVISALTAATVNDQYWAPVAQGIQPSSGTITPVNPNTKVGQVIIKLTPAAANVVEASSVMTFYVSPAALMIGATGTF